MSQHWIYINSPTYRRFIAASTERKSLLYMATAVLGGASLVAGYLTMNATNPNVAEEGYKKKDAELAKLPMHSQVPLERRRGQRGVLGGGGLVWVRCDTMTPPPPLQSCRNREEQEAARYSCKLITE
jgi:hypothetical protein